MRACVGRWCSGLSGLVLWLGTSVAAAAELSIALPSACAIGDELSFRAERALGKPLGEAAPVRCTLHITRSTGAYAAQLEVAAIGSAGPARQRTFRAPTCEQLTETLAVAVVLAIGAEQSELAASAPAGPAAADAPRAEPPGRSAATAAGVTDAPARSALPGDGTRAPGVRVHAALLVDSGTLPGAGLGAELAASLGWEALALRLLGTYLPERRAALDPSGAAAIRLLAGSLSACLPRLAGWGELEMGACAGAELGWLEGTGTGLDVDRSGGTLWGAGRGDATVRWALGRGVGLEVALSALLPVERDEFAVAGIGRVHRPGAVVGRASLGLSIELGAAARTSQ